MSNEDRTNMLFCPRCQKPVRRLRPGSLTSWVFKAATCACNIAPLSGNASPELIAAQTEEIARLKISTRFQILSELGAGGMGTVYVGKDLATDEIVAIKVLREDLANNESAVKRFQEEVLATQYLTHPNMVSIQGYGTTDDGAPYLVMEYVDGANLAELIKQEGYLKPDIVLDMFINVSEALADAHEKDIVHRDIKPENILVMPISDDELRIKVVDFGIAKVLFEVSTDDTREGTQSTDIVGSPLYMSPEQCLGLPVDKRTDVYAIGCVMYEVLTGSSPFYSSNPVKTILMHLNEQPKPFIEVAPNLEYSPDLELIVMKCLRKDPRMRYPSVTHLRNDLIACKNKRVTNAMQEELMVHGLTILVLGILLGTVAFFLFNPLFAWKVFSPGKVVEITDRYTGKSLYSSITSKSVRDAVKEAVDKHVDLSGADLSGRNLAGLDLTNAKLRESDLQDACLTLADLTKADLSYSNLNGLVAPRATMIDANLSGVSMTGASLRASRFNNSILRNADLSNADLSNADVTGVDFKHTDIQNAKFVQTIPDSPRLDSSYGVPRTRL